MILNMECEIYQVHLHVFINVGLLYIRDIKLRGETDFIPKLIRLLSFIKSLQLIEKVIQIILGCDEKLYNASKDA